MSWIVKFEKEVESCKECPLLLSVGYGVYKCYDGTYQIFREQFEGRIIKEGKLPSEIRTCPFEVK